MGKGGIIQTFGSSASENRRRRSLILASGCAALTSRRTGYSLVYNDVRQFSDLGCHESGEGARKSGSGGSTKTTAAGVAANSIASGVTDGQQYSLYPNPSDGNISLHQYAPDNGPVMAEIMNATGQKVYNGQLHFSEGVAKLSMGNVAPGLYLVKLIDSKQRTFMLKFVIK